MDGRIVKGKVNQTGGGVGRNIADALGKLQINPYLISAVGSDNFGSTVLNSISHLSKKGILRSTENTSTCVVVCDNTGECILIVGDMDIHGNITPAHVENYLEDIASSSLVIFDGNLSQNTMKFLLSYCRENRIPVWFEPTDIIRAREPFLDKTIPPPTFMSPSLFEFRKIFETVRPEIKIQESDVISECIEKGYLLAEIVENVIITLGKNGVIIIRKGKKTDAFYTKMPNAKILQTNGPISHRYYKSPSVKEDEIVNVSGAGDCFASGFISAMLKGESEECCVEFGFRCSAASLKSFKTVPEKF